jgi:hypothetical protein
MVTPHFQGILDRRKNFFVGSSKIIWKLFFILVNVGVSGDVSIQMPTKMPLFEA